MYRAMIVDDDAAVRESYREMKAWEEYGFCVVCEAAHGARALSLLKENTVDVVFTDIHMPFMNGLELMKEALLINPQLLFVVVSNSGVFDYVREALRLRAVDYLLKPLKEQELDDVLNRLRECLHRQNKNSVSNMLEKLLGDDRTLHDELMARICMYFERYIHKNFTIEDMAEAFSMNKDYLGRQIKRRTSLSFPGLYNRIKVEYAKELMCYSDCKVSKISHILGYTSSDYFSRIFKNITNMTPAEYKKSLDV